MTLPVTVRTKIRASLLLPLLAALSITACAGSSAPPATPGFPLEDTQWVLQTLGGEPAQPGAQDKSVDIRFEAEESRALGFSGCNRYFGGYTLNRSNSASGNLSFGPIAGTRMACPPGPADIEGPFLQMLEKVTQYQLRKDTLILLRNRKELAIFTAQ